MSGSPTPEPALPEDEPLRNDTPVDNVADDDEFLPEDFEDDPNDDRPRTTRKRVGLGGQMIGAAMLGLAEVLEPKQKQDAPIEVTNPGKPLDLDKDGLDEMDTRILESVIVKFAGGPVGVSSLAVAVGEEPDTIEEVYEPYLILEGYIQRTPQGRICTEKAYRKLGLTMARTGQGRLL